MSKRDRFKEQVEDNLVIFRNELCPYEYNIKASDKKESLSINIYAYEKNLPHLLGLQQIAPYIKGEAGINVIEKGKISKGRLYSGVKNSFKRRHVIDKNQYFRYVPLILSISTPLYLYKNKKTALFDSDYLLVKKLIVKRAKEVYIHVGIKESNEAGIYVLNSVLVTHSDDLDYDIYFSGQPFYIIECITKTHRESLLSETTYCERSIIDKALEEKAKYLQKEKAKLTAKIVKHLERIDRKTGSTNTLEDIKTYYEQIHTIKDARLRNLIRYAYKIIEKLK